MAKRNWKKLIEQQQTIIDNKKREEEENRRNEFSSFLSDSSDYLKRETEAYNASDFNTYKSAMDTFQSGSKDWKNRSSAAKSFLREFSSSMSDEEYKSYLDYIDQFDKALAAFEADYGTKKNYYSQFGTEEEEKKFASAMEFDIEADKKALSDMISSFNSQKNDNKFNQPWQLSRMEQEEKNKEITAKRKEIEEARDIQYGSKYAGYKPSEIEKILTPSNWTEENKPSEDEIQWLLDNKSLFEENLSDAEKAKKYELAKIRARMMAASPEGAYTDEYASATKWMNEYEAQQRDKRAEYMAENHPVLASLETVLTSPLNAVGLGEDILRTIKGVEIDPNSSAHFIQQSNEAIRENISKELSGFGSFIYNTGMSMLDTVVRLPLGGAGLAVAGAGAAASQIADAKKRGASDEQAVASGVAAGVAEALFESFGLKGLTELAQTGGAGLKNAAKSVAKQLWTEGNEELLTEIANIVTDSIINGELSNAALTYQKYLESDGDENKAMLKTAADLAKQVGEAWLGGALSGGVFGLGGAAVNAVNNYTVGRDLIKGKQAEETAALAGAFGADSLTAKRLQEYEKKAEKKGKPSASYTGALYQAMTKEGFENLSAERRRAIESTVKTKLEEKGLNSDDSTVKAVSKAVFGQVYGNEKMTSSEKKIVAEKEYSAAVNELAASPELAVEIQSDEKYKAAEQKVDKLEQIAVKTDVSNSIESKVRSMNVQSTGAELKNLSVDANGDVYAVDGEGTRTPVAKAALTEEAATAVAYSEEMSPAKKKAFFEMYSQVADSIPVDEYHTAFDLAYTYGLKFGGNVDKAVEIAGPVLTEAGALAVFKKGLEQRGAIKAENDAQIQSFRDALGIKTKGGTVDDKAIRYADLHPSDPRRAVVEFTKVIAQATGRNFVYFRSTAKEQAKGKENGRYEPETNTIYIDINAGINETKKILQDQVLPTVSHELVHIFAVENPSGYSALADLVFEGLKKAEGKTRSFLISQEIQRINEADENSDEKRLAGKSEETIRAIAEEEIVARACEDRLANSRLMKEFIEEMERKESGLAQKFSDMLGEAIKRLKKIFQQIASKLSRSHEATQLRKLTTELEAIQEQYDALLERRNTESTSTSPEQQKNTSDRGVMSAEREKDNFSQDFETRVLDSFGIKKLNDYVHIQKKVISTLFEEGFFIDKENRSRNDVNEESGLVIETNKSGIDETFSFNNFVRLGKFKKIAKLVTIRELPNVIKKGRMVADDVANKYSNSKNKKFAYIEYATEVDEKEIVVRIAIKKSPQKNKFWVHSIYKIENVSGSPASTNKSAEAGHITADTKRILTPKGESVNPQNSETDKGEMKADRDSGGNVLSEAQKEYFKDSKVRDKNGNLLIMYHGTPNAVFTKFRPGTYFTEHKWYADVYQGQGASSLGYKRTADKPDTYEVYLNIKKPFDTRNKTERDIFYNEYYGKWGTGTDLMESGLPDWMDGTDLLEFLEEMDYDYDGIVLDEGGVGGYGVEVKSRGISYVIMDPSQVKNIDNKNPTSNPDIRYADRAKYMTAREILMQFAADEELKNDQAYSPLLREYASRITELDKKYIQLEAAEHDYVASIDAFDSEDKQAKYKYRVDELSREIARIERDLSKQEESKALKKLVLREKAATRKQTEKEAKRDTAQRMSNYRNSIEKRSALERIEKKAGLLEKKLRENKRKSHIPDDLKKPLDKFLGYIKFSIRDIQYGYGTPAEVEFQAAPPVSEQSTFVKDAKNALKELRKAIEQNSQIPIVQAEKQSTDTTEGSQGAAYSGILMIDPHILDKMDSLASYLEKLTDDGITYELAELDLDQAKSLDKILTSVSRDINSIDRAFAGQGKEKISDLGESSMAYMKPIIDESKKKGSSKLAKFLKDATTWEEMTPYTAFSQFGEGGQTIYWNILRGWGDYAFYAKQILDFAKKTWTPEEAKEWSETVKTYKLADQEFEATTAQMMYLYLLSKREQGKLHLNGDGFVIGDYTITKAGVKKTVEAKKVSAIKSTEKERDAFFDHYLPKGSREREVAETMQRFLADTSGAWGNELSYKLYGYRAFTDPNYVPIVADPTKLSASAGDFQGGLYRLMNMGFTKPLNPKANNSVFAVDLFEVFAAHAADMAKYRSLALPTMDAIRWMNYSPEFEMEDGSVVRDPNNLQSVMGAAYGTAAFNYVKQFIMDLNGSNGDKVNSMEALAASLTRAYKTAAVGANLKVVALQPTSYLRALAVLDRSSLIKAFSYMESEDEKGKTDGKKAKKAFDQATQNSGMALWKSLGYYDVGIGRTLTDQIKQYESLYDKALDLSMKLAAKADEMTLGVLFKACQIQLIDSGKAAGLSREELLKAAGELLDEVIVRTQVVDSTVTRSQLMRSKSKFTKNLTAFMSEPTVAYNLILQVVFDMQHDLRRGMSFKQALQNNKRTLKKNFAAYAATALAAAAVETLFAALRRREDEDEEEILDGILNGLLENSKTFGGKILENANPLGMIPLVDDLFGMVASLLTGKKNYSDDMELAAAQSMLDMVQSIWDMATKGGFTVEKLFSTIDDGTKAASYLTGLPIANAIREVKTVWNNTIGEWFDVMWDMRAPGTADQLEKAFKKGDLRVTVNGLLDQKYLELQEERPNVSSSELRDRAKNSVKSSATAFFKKRYLDALKKGDRKKMDEIRSAMRQTGLYDHANQTAFEWEEAYREDRREKGLD